MVSPLQHIEKIKQGISQFKIRLDLESKKKISDFNFKLKNLMSLLDSLSPLKVVDRGFSITTVNQQVVKSIADVKIADLIEIKVADGELEAKITRIKKIIKGS